MADPSVRPGLDLPPSRLTDRGLPRRVGVEIEFMGLSARSAARALSDGLGGRVRQEDPHAYTVENTSLGDLAVEIDLRYAHPHRRRTGLAVPLGPQSRAWLGSALSPFVPRELITRPVALDRLAEVDDAVAILRAAGATGRGAILFGSLGLHFNVDPPALDAGTVTGLLKALLLMDEKIRRATVGNSAWLRRALPPPYPEAYMRRVVAPSYWPDLNGLADDYLAANPTRRRSLDLLPLLLHFDEQRVRAVLPNEKIGKRAALHYRLPQAHVGEPGWSIVPAWNRWAAVERLAGDRAALADLGHAYLARGKPKEGQAA